MSKPKRIIKNNSKRNLKALIHVTNQHVGDKSEAWYDLHNKSILTAGRGGKGHGGGAGLHAWNRKGRW